MKLYFVAASNNNLMWAPIIDKAWAKVKGSYMNSNAGMSANALRFMTGAPTITFDTVDIE
jgi:calpain-15